MASRAATTENIGPAARRRWKQHQDRKEGRASGEVCLGLPPDASRLVDRLANRSWEKGANLYSCCGSARLWPSDKAPQGAPLRPERLDPARKLNLSLKEQCARW